MKTSHILFALAIATATTAIFYREFIGNVTMTLDNQPSNALSRFWLNFYDLKVSHPLPRPVKHIRVSGIGKQPFVVLGTEKTENRSVFGINPQGYTVRVEEDTLFLEVERDFAYVRLQQSEPIFGVSVRNGNLNLSRPFFHPDSVAFLLEEGSSLTISRGEEDQADSIARVRMEVRGHSTVSLIDEKMEAVSALLDNSTLTYRSVSQVDSLFVALKGESKVYSRNWRDEQGVKKLVISGDRQHFNEEFAGKGVEVISP